MKMDGWEDYLHFTFHGEHIILKSLRLSSFTNFFLGSLLTIAICFTERLLTFALAKNWNPFPSVRRSRLRNTVWKTTLYWLVTLNRLIYMLIAMSYHVGLILVTVTALTIGQFVIEYLDYSQYESREYTEPLLKSSARSSNQSSRPRSRSKPDGIFIHPNHSNLARADAVALQMGIAGETERVKGNFYPETEDNAWEYGRGREVARELMRSQRLDSIRQPFDVGEDEDEDESV